MFDHFKQFTNHLGEHIYRKLAYENFKSYHTLQACNFGFQAITSNKLIIKYKLYLMKSVK